MPGEIAYIPENVGDWGIPEATAGGSYGTDSLEMADGTRVFFRFWKTPHAEDPVLVFIHGLGAHTGWFIDMGNQLNARGLNVYMDDHRAFGRSGGVRGHVRHGTIYIDDLKRFLAEVQKRHPGAPLFLCGHSMGGIFATYLAAGDVAAQFPLLKGLILVNPWIRDGVKVKPSAMVQVLAGGISGSDKIVGRGVDTQEHDTGARGRPPARRRQLLGAKSERIVSLSGHPDAPGDSARGPPGSPARSGDSDRGGQDAGAEGDSRLLPTVGQQR